MALDGSKLSERQRDEATVELLRKLREKLLSDNISTARVAGLNLAWKQEDGLTILSEVLFGEYPRTAKKAAAYGLRSMNGRMKKLGIEVLEKGLKHRNRTTKAVCIKSISLIKAKASGKGGSGSKPATGRHKITEIRSKNTINRRSTMPSNRRVVSNDNFNR